MNEFLFAVIGIFIIAYVAYLIWSIAFLIKLSKRSENMEKEGRFILDHIVHTRSSLNLIYTSIATVTFILAFLGFNLKDRITQEVTKEIATSAKVDLDTLKMKANDIAKLESLSAQKVNEINKFGDQFHALLDEIKKNPLRIGQIFQGSTPEENTPWEKYAVGRDGLKLNISTEKYGFKSTPIYFASLAGVSEHATAIGVSSIYNASPKGFTIYIFQTRLDDNADLLQKAKDLRWHVQWIAFLK